MVLVAFIGVEVAALFCFFELVVHGHYFAAIIPALLMLSLKASYKK